MTSAPPWNAGRYRRGVASFITALTLAAFLTGCGPADTGLQADTAQQLQARVLRVSEAVAANDRDGALKALDVLAVDLARSAGAGEVSAERQRRIATVIAAVRADLTGTQFVAQSAAVSPAEAEPAEAGAEAAPVVPEPAPAIPAPVVPAPAPAVPAPAAPVPAPVDPAPAPSDSSNGNSANGNGNRGNEGKGKGRDN